MTMSQTLVLAQLDTMSTEPHAQLVPINARHVVHQQQHALLALMQITEISIKIVLALPDSLIPEVLTVQPALQHVSHVIVPATKKNRID